ncbi:MAG: DUF4908 domain-containing protein [Pseudomonadota bacterium]
MRAVLGFVALISAGAANAGSISCAQSAPLTQSHTDDANNPFKALVNRDNDRFQANTLRGADTARYILATDDRTVLVQDRAGDARITFLCGQSDTRLGCTIDTMLPAAEIFRVTPTRAPRGDVIYKSTEGETLMRIATYGGATVFWPGDARGNAASKSFGDDNALRLPFANYAVASRRANLATALISAETGAPIVFDIGPPPRVEDENVAVLADAVVRAAEGVAKVARDSTGARAIAAQAKRVKFERKEEIGVALNDGVLEIHYAPSDDIDGRPSSAMVARFLEETL